MGTGLGESHVMVSSPGLALLICRLGTAPRSFCACAVKLPSVECCDYSSQNCEGRDGDDAR